MSFVFRLVHLAALVLICIIVIFQDHHVAVCFMVDDIVFEGVLSLTKHFINYETESPKINRPAVGLTR
jgi:hypothetical protein